MRLICQHQALPPESYFVPNPRKKGAAKTIYWLWNDETQEFESGYIEYLWYGSDRASVKATHRSHALWHEKQVRLSQLFRTKAEAEAALAAARAACIKAYGDQITGLASALAFPLDHDLRPGSERENLARTAYLEQCQRLFDLDLSDTQS